MKTFEKILQEINDNLVEEMVHYPSENPVYQDDSKFQDISVDNIKRMSVLTITEEFVFVVSESIGYVFSLTDYKEANHKVKPVMHVHLRDSLFGYKQAHKLRIRKSYSGNNIAEMWYMSYLKEFGGIISDTEHLEGGYRLWKSFIKTATESSEFNIKLVDKNIEEVIIDSVTTELPDDQMWSRYTKENKDRSKEHLVLVMEKL